MQTQYCKTTVVNLYKHKYDVYMGRPGKGQDGYYANPFSLQKGEIKGSTLPRYRKYFYDRIASDPEFKEKILALEGKILGCFCDSIETCHVGIIIEYINEKRNQHQM